ncbi:MAG TPA: ABC transporter ATP-binding protein/permease [Candidatus Eubacterium avistercoris]|uniref:ABC transporter ATP-binding protein/permease n=1 Tax=Candidatus Eubacterium avistercoris TaxID=2838567 RepID=A0A9D2IE63_9FIRM|nr:ABC transporter ATP-binding protein/permease [Candidatus Eubacterium avistercoris]
MLKILKYLKKQEWVYVVFSVAFIAVQVWLDLKLPDYMSDITTLIQTEGSTMREILVQGGYMLLCALGSMATSIVVGFFAAKVAAGLARRLRGMVYDKTLSFSMEEINSFSSASLITRTTNDIVQIQMIIAMGLQVMVKGPILAVWAIVKIAGKSWQWTTATGVAVIILIAVFGIIIGLAMPKFKRIQSLTDNVNRVSREQLIGLRVVRAYNAEEYQEDKFEVANEELTRTNRFAFTVMAIMVPSITLIQSGLSLAVYWLGAHMIEAAAFEDKVQLFSNMVVFSAYAIQVIMAFMLMAMIFIMLPRANVSALRIMEVLDKKNHITDGKRKEGAAGEKGTIEFKDVSFRYPDAAENMIEHISFTARKGETVAIIGSTGSGKSTLVNLIPRFYDATEGQVLVDGVDVREYNQKALRDKIGYVSQKAILFSGTVSTNVAYGDMGESMTGDQVRRGVRIAQAEEFVQKMDGTYDAHIAQGGSNVSGGQKQRLSIARAIARNPEIYIFDDSFSALDYKTDRILRNALKKEIKDATMLIVAQRIGTIKDADRIIVLDDGKVAGMGTHEELLKNCRTYQEIAYSQLSKEELANA